MSLILSNHRILITGGAGFIGSHLAEALLAENAAVCVLDNFDQSYAREIKQSNLKTCLQLSKFQFVEGDILDVEQIDKIFGDFQPDVVIHLAAKAGVRPSITNPLTYTEVNIKGTQIMLEAAKKFKLHNFVFASSSSVYGNHSEIPFKETDPTDKPLSPYGATKKAGEVLCHSYHHLYKINVSCLRFFTVYGLRQRPDLAIHKFVKAALLNQEIPIYGDGSTQRDYTHIRDILAGIKGAVIWGNQPSPRFGIFNLGSSKPVRLNDLINKIEYMIGQPLRRTYFPMQQGDVLQTYADTSLAEHGLGFNHQVDFTEGLKEFIDWMRDQI